MEMKKKADIRVLIEERNGGNPPSCFDDVLCTLAHLFKREYKFFYAKRWEFVNIIKGKHQAGRGNAEYFEEMLRLQGFTIKEIQKEQFLQRYQEILNKYICVVAFFDGYELPWDTYYQQNHNSHALIIKSVDAVNGNVFCCDPWHNLENVSLKTAELKCGLKKLYVPIVGEMQTSDEQRVNFIYECMKNVNKNMFREMKDLADNLTEESDFNELFKYINVVAWNRWTLGICFKTMGTVSDNLYQYGLEMQKNSNLWNSVKLALIKCGVFKNLASNRLGSLVAYVKKNIYGISVREEDLYTRITQNKEVRALETEKQSNLSIGCDLKKIKIDHLFNNMGISSSSITNVKTDLTGTGESFILDDLCDGIFIGNGTKNDNIICDGQVIDSKSKYIKNLYILGCCEWGDYSDFLIVNIDTEKEKKIMLSLSDWSEGPKFGEKIVVTGSLKKNGIESDDSRIKAYIYMIKLCVECCVDTITLPRCTNMHIMDIRYE